MKKRVLAVYNFQVTHPRGITNYLALNNKLVYNFNFKDPGIFATRIKNILAKSRISQNSLFLTPKFNNNSNNRNSDCKYVIVVITTEMKLKFNSNCTLLL